jgi:hypothetical protein
MTLTCSGSIGKPKSTLSLKRKSPSVGKFEVVQDLVVEYDIYDSTNCAFNRTLSYSFVVSSSLENTTYKCETTGSNGTSYSSKNETVKIQNACKYANFVEKVSSFIVYSTCKLFYTNNVRGLTFSWDYHD